VKTSIARLAGRVYKALVTRASECLVVGAGAIGMASALRLAERGLAVTLFDRGAPGDEASSAAGGILAPLAESHGPGALLELLLAARRRWPAFAEELRARSDVDLCYRSDGTLALAYDEDAVEALRRRAEWQRGRDLAVEILTPAQALALEPAIAPPLLALRFGGDHQVDNVRLVRALAAACLRAGVRIERTCVRRVRHDGARVLGLDLDDGPRDAPLVLVTAGAWSSRLDGMPLPATAIEPVRGQMIELTTPLPPFRHLLFGVGGYLVPRSDGRILCGSTEERVGFVKEVTLAGLQTFAARVARICPALASLPVARSWAGLRPATRDHLPLIGETAIAGLHVAAGHFRNGILLAPLTADLVCALVTGTPPPGDLPEGPSLVSPARA
jgi:glycine oxidase